MSEYIVTARKYRPMRFDDVEAQKHVTQTLKNAIKQQRLAHAYLFAGPRGVGKTTTARLLAKLVNCASPTADSEPDNTCEICTEITEGRSFDVQEIDGASNRGVDEIRNLREAVRYAPAKSKYKVYIIDEVHMLTKEAFNALLKTLEEPPSHVLFILATTEIHKLPATIISRCQRFDFRRIAIDEIMSNLKGIAAKEGLKIEDDALMLIAKKGDGSLRDSQSIFDQVVALCGKEITKAQILQALNIVDQDFYFRVTDLVKTKDARGGLDLVQDIMNRGYDIKEFLSGLTEHLRNLLTAITSGSSQFIEESDVYKQRYAGLSKEFSAADVLRMLRLVNSTEQSVRWASQPRFKLETDLVQMITMPAAAEVGEVLSRIDQLKKKLHDGAAEAGQPAAPVVAEPAARRPSSPAPVSTSRGGARPSFSRSSPPPKPETQEEPESASPLSEGEIRSRWSEFVAEVRRQRIAVGSVLESGSFAGVSGSTIRIAVPNEFTASAISRNRELLATTIQKVFNARGRVEALINPAIDSTIELDSQASTAPQQSKPAEENPLLKTMIKELGMEPL